MHENHAPPPSLAEGLGVFDTPLPRDPAPPMEAAPPVGARPLWRRVASVASGLSLVLASCVIAVGAWAWWWAEQAVGDLQAGEKAAIVAQARPVLGTEPAGLTLPDPSAASGRVTTFLLIGSDSRDTSRGNSDTMILARLDEGAGTLSLLSIPRDLYVPIPRHSPFKVNGAYALGGVGLTIETLRDYFGVRIDHFVMVDFAGFQDVVDQLGGVNLTVDRRYYNHNDGSWDSNYADIDLRPGYQHLGGDDALAFVRYRHTDSDTYRVARQQQFLREVKRQVEATRGLDTFPLVRRFTKALTSDIDSLRALVGYANAVRDIPPERIVRITLPTTSGTGADGRFYLYADPDDVTATMARWADPVSALDREAARAQAPDPAVAGPLTHNEPVATHVGDDGEAASLIAAARPEGLATCTPAERASGATYESEATHAYQLDGEDALALSTHLGPGRDYVWMWTRAQDPPVLERASEQRTIDGRDYRLLWEAGDLRAVAFTHNGSLVWLTNTLRNDLSAQTMLALARSCR